MEWFFKQTWGHLPRIGLNGVSRMVSSCPEKSGKAPGRDADQVLPQ